MSKYKIGMFGFGCVGQGLYETLQKNAEINAEIAKICIKDVSKSRSLSADKFTVDPESILEDSSIDIVVELIDDPYTAFEIVKKAVEKGKAVVTANKKMVAENLSTLLALQEQHKTPILYEGAVCGSIPIIRTLEDYYSSEKIHEIKGILNGSTNYILTKVIDENKSYKEALKEAQENGFAETDPTLDVEGYDPKFKLSILLQHAFGVQIHPTDIFNQGIQDISEYDIAFANKRGLKIKLLGKAIENEGDIYASVAPHFVDNHSPLYHVENEYNSVLINGEFADNQVLTGKGAGKLPTGLAVLSDVSALTRGYKYLYSKSGEEYTVAPKTEEVYISFRASSVVDWSIFDVIHEKYVGKENGHVIGDIDLEKLQKYIKSGVKGISIIFTSGRREEIGIPKLTYSYQES